MNSAWHNVVGQPKARQRNADFILLDRSGSMAGIWKQAVEAVNIYVGQLRKNNVDTQVTVAVFDSEGSMRFSILRDLVHPFNFVDIAQFEAHPRGNTPLNDATAKLIKLADDTNAEKTAVVIMTDGGENDSREYAGPTGTNAIKFMLDNRRKRGWQVVMLGMDFVVEQQAMHYGTTAEFAVSSPARNLGQTMSYTASNRSAWSSGASPDMAYTDEQKAKVDEGAKA